MLQGQGGSGGRGAQSRVVSGRREVRKEMREGPQTACWTYEWLKRSERAASASRFGEWASASP